jgi:2-dehydro-3-deoxygluconokinase
LRAFGVGEIAVKNGPNSVLVAMAKDQLHVPAPAVVTPIDTSGAGDAFNAAYLAARLTGETSQHAAAAGHRLAGEVIRHPGALMPRADAAVH